MLHLLNGLEQRFKILRRDHFRARRRRLRHRRRSVLRERLEITLQGFVVALQQRVDHRLRRALRDRLRKQTLQEAQLIGSSKKPTLFQAERDLPEQLLDMHDIFFAMRVLQGPIAGAQAEIDAGRALIKAIRCDGERVERAHDAIFVHRAANGEILPLLDQRARQGIGEHARGQRDPHRLAHARLAERIGRFEHDVDIEARVRMFGQILIRRDLHRLCRQRRRRQIDDQRFSTAAMRRDDRPRRNHAIVIAGDVGDLECAAFGGGRYRRERNGRRNVRDRLQIPAAERTSARTHAECRRFAELECALVLAVRAGEARAIDADGEARRVVRAMDPEIDGRADGDGHLRGAGTEIDRCLARVRRRVDPRVHRRAVTRSLAEKSGHQPFESAATGKHETRDQKQKNDKAQGARIFACKSRPRKCDAQPECARKAVPQVGAP